METLTEVMYSFLCTLFFPLILPLLFLAFWPDSWAEKELIRTGKLFVAKTILVYFFPLIGYLAEFIFSWDSMYFDFAIIFLVGYVILTSGVIYYSRSNFQSKKVFWLILFVDVLYWVPYSALNVLYGYARSYNEYLFLNLVYEKNSSINFDLYSFLYIYFPSLFVAIIMIVLLMNMMKLRRLQAQWE